MLMYSRSIGDDFMREQCGLALIALRNRDTYMHLRHGRATSGTPANVLSDFLQGDDRFLFDERQYLRYPDLQQAKSRHASFDLFQHFLDNGSREGRSPSLLVDLHFVRYKLNRYLGIDVPLADTLDTFLGLSRAERFVPNPWFSPWSFRRLYSKSCGEISRLGDYELLQFYATHVRERALSPNGLFSEERYRQ